MCVRERDHVCIARGYLWCHYDCPCPSLPQNCPGLPLCSCKACGWLNLWRGRGLGYKFIPLSALSSRAENQHSHTQEHLLTHTHAHWWCRIPSFSPPPSVGPGAGWVEDGWWHHSPSRRGIRLGLWLTLNGGRIWAQYQTHTCSHTLLIFLSAKLPRRRGKTHTNTALFYSVHFSVRAKDAVHARILLLTQPCADPVLNPDALQTPAQAYVCMLECVCVSVCVLSVCRVNLLRSSEPALL